MVMTVRKKLYWTKLSAIEQGAYEEIFIKAFARLFEFYQIELLDHSENTYFQNKLIYHLSTVGILVNIVCKFCGERN